MCRINFLKENLVRNNPNILVSLEDLFILSLLYIKYYTTNLFWIKKKLQTKFRNYMKYVKISKTLLRSKGMGQADPFASRCSVKGCREQKIFIWLAPQYMVLGLSG
jgi:hypothetical protein